MMPSMGTRRSVALILLGVLFLILGIFMIYTVVLAPVGFIFILVGIAFLASGTGRSEFEQGG